MWFGEGSLEISEKVLFMEPEIGNGHLEIYCSFLYQFVIHDFYVSDAAHGSQISGGIL